MKNLSFEEMEKVNGGRIDSSETAQEHAIMSAVCLVGSLVPVVGTVIFGSTSAILVGIDLYCAYN